jgi:hypothetical protein
MFHGETRSTDIYGNKISLAVLSTRESDDERDGVAQVAIQIMSGNLHSSFTLTPEAARDLASRLVAAVVSVSVARATPEAEIREFEVRDELEAA